MDKIKDAGFGWVRLNSKDLSPILYAINCGLDVIVVLDIREAFTEYYQAKADKQHKAALEVANKIMRDATDIRDAAWNALEDLRRKNDPLGLLKPLIETARQTLETANNALNEACQKANLMIFDADFKYEKYLKDSTFILSRLEESAFIPGWEGIWQSHIEERIAKLRTANALVQHYQILNEPNHGYHNPALAHNLDLAAKVVNIGSEVAKAKHRSLWKQTPETMVNLFFRWCNIAGGFNVPESYFIDDRPFIEIFRRNASSIDTMLLDIYPLTWHVLTLDNKLPILPTYLPRYLEDYHQRWRDSSGQAKPVGIMETGWCTLPHAWLDNLIEVCSAGQSTEFKREFNKRIIPRATGEVEQKEYFNWLFDAMDNYLVNKDWVKYLGIYEYDSTEEWYDNKPGLPCENYFGLNHKEGKEKLAWKNVESRMHLLREKARKKVGITYHI
jgi:hypothetical protein